MNAALKAGVIRVNRIPLLDLDTFAHKAFLQKSFWALQKEAFGWKAHAFEILVLASPDHVGAESMVGAARSAVLVLERQLARGIVFLYVPHGPEEGWVSHGEGILHAGRGTVLRMLAQQIAVFIGTKPVFVRYDLNWVIASRPCLETGRQSKENGNISTDSDVSLSQFDAIEIRNSLNLSPLRPSSADVQPPDTVILDIQTEEEQLLAEMKPKTRYNIRLAEKKGVRVVSAGLDRLLEWYELYRLTGERDRIALHSFEYYKTLMENNSDKCELLLAYHENDLLAGIILLYSEYQATYLYGASGNIKRNLMPAYALQWAAIRAAKARGCISYDFFGLPPSDDPGHPMHGLFQFKTGFGGCLISTPGCWDATIRPGIHVLLQIAETARYWYFKKLRKSRT